MDALAGWAGFRPADLLELRARHRGARGCRRLDRVVDLAEPAADSPMESRLRLSLLLRGLPRPAVGYRVVDERWRVVAVLDLAYPEARVGIEYDGDGHLDRARRNHDHERDGRLIELGWLILRFNNVDVRRRADQTADRVRRVRTARLGVEFGRTAV